jgi:4-hydroxy-3-methylbut-2-enyl diphosphate reductase
MKIRLASPRGFCSGVERAIEIVELALERYGAPIYVRHEIVHNRSVVDSLRAKGVVFIDRPSAAPRGSVLIFSAHGVSPDLRIEAEEQDLRVIDATCPLVTKVHLEAKRFASAEKEILLIGHKGHVEVEGTMGEAPTHTRLIENVVDAQEVVIRDPDRAAVLTQTTLSVHDTAEIFEVLRRRFPSIATPKRADICYATQNRQDAVKGLASKCDLVIVVGSANSSNGMRLVEAARRMGVRVERVDDASELDANWLTSVERVGVTSGAAVPETLVQEVVSRLEVLGSDPVEIESTPIVDEGMHFQLPALLRGARA